MSGRFWFRAGVVVVVTGLLGFWLGSLRHPEQVRVEPEARTVGKDPERGGVVTARAQGKIDLLLLADRDPARALAKLQAEAADGDWDAHSESYTALFSAWATSDAHAALAALETVDRRFLSAAIKGIVEAVHDRDPAWAGELLVKFQFDIGGLTPSWLMEDPAVACQLLSQMQSSNLGAVSAAQAWAKLEPQAAWDWANSQSGSFGHSAIRTVLRTWAENDLEGAIKFYESGAVDELKLREFFESEMAKNFAKEAPEEAIEWLKKSGESHGREDAIHKIVKEWAGRDLDAAVAWAESQTGREKRWATGLQIDAKLVAGDAKGAAESFLAGDAMAQTQGTARNIGRLYIKQDPAAALDWADQLPAPVRSATTLDLFARLIHQDREVAVAEFDARIDRLSIPTVERFSAEYFKKDVEAATAWLATLPRGLAYDVAHNGIYRASREGGGEALLQLGQELEKTK